MDDAGARHAGERRRVMQQGVGEGAVPVAGARVDDHPGRLVDDDDGLVLVHDLEPDRLRRVPVAGAAGGRAERHTLAAPDFPFHVGLRRVDRDSSRAHPRLQPAPGVLRKEARERLVEPQAGELGGYGALDWRAIIFTSRLICDPT